MPGTLIENGVVLTVNSSDDVYPEGYLYFEDDQILVVTGGSAPKEIRDQADEVIDASGQIVMPGLVNAHVHLFQTLIRGLSDNRPLIPWLEQVAFPVYEKMQPEDIWLAVQMGIAENIRGGATAVIDDFTVRQPPETFDTVFRVMNATGMRYKMARGYSDTGYPEDLMETGDQVIASTQHLFESCCKGNDLLSIDFSPNVIWSTTPETLTNITQLAKEWGIGIHIHTAEDAHENTMCIEKNGMRQVPWLHKMGVLGPKTQLAHGIWIDDDEIELIAESGACVVHNPVSNMFIASGICPVEKMLSVGVPVALGSDGQAVNCGQEMLDVLKWAVNLQKVHALDASILTPEQAIRLACQGGAYAFGQPDQIGSLEPGKKADVIIVDTDDSRLSLPSLSVPSLLVNFAKSGDVVTTIVNGAVLMQDRELTVFDEERLIKEFRASRAKLLSRAGIS